MPDDLAIPPLRPPPAGYVVRRPNWDDLRTVTALHAEVSRRRIGAVILREADLRMRWLELETFEDALLVETPPPSPSLVAYAAFEADLDPWTEELDLHVDSSVHPDHTGRGLGSFLLGRAEDRARLAARRHGRERAVLRTAVIDGDASARAFYVDRGFEAVRHLLELRLDLHAAPPSPTWPPGVRCRSFDPGRDDLIAWQTHQVAFADVPTYLPLDLDEWLETRIGHDAAFDPGLLLLAEHDGDPVGIAVCRAGTEVAAEDGWVRDLGVVPAWRRHGIGMALLREAFAAFRARGLTGVALEVDDVTVEGAVALYRRAGMRIVRRTDVMERLLAVEAPTGPG